jgi:Ca2+-binding EF-hand superfamily protein
MRSISTAALILVLSGSLLAQARQNRRANPGQMDADGDGRISSAEWQGPAAAFDRLDANDDGYISRDELPQARARNRARNPRAMDTNQDGKIAREEWSGPAAAFERLDANKDGFITADERPRANRGRRGQRPSQQ